MNTEGKQLIRESALSLGRMNDSQKFLALPGMTEEKEFVISNPKRDEKSLTENFIITLIVSNIRNL